VRPDIGRHRNSRVLGVDLNSPKLGAARQTKNLVAANVYSKDGRTPQVGGMAKRN